MEGIFRFFWKNWRLAVGLAILVLILAKVSIPVVVSGILSARKGYFAASAILSLPIFFLKSLRWRYLLQRQGVACSTGSAASIYFSALFLGLVTPGKFAEVSKSAFLVRRGFSLGKSLFSTFFDRLSDIAGLGLVVATGLFFFNSSGAWIYLAPMFVIFVVVIWEWKLLRKFFVAFAGLLVVGRLKGAARKFGGDFIGEIRLLDLKTMAVLGAFTILSLGLYYLQAYFLALSVGIGLNAFYVAFAVSIAAFAAIVPVSVLGIGTRDAALVFLFAQAGVSRELAISYSFLVLANLAILAVICSFFWFRSSLFQK